MFDKLKKFGIAQRKSDQAFYTIVAQEMECGVRHHGLWLKALEQAGGNEERQVAEYIKLRVQSLKDDASIVSDQREGGGLNSYAPDIDAFATMLSEGSTVGEIDSYFSGMSPREIREFINQPDACEDFPIHIALKRRQLDVLGWLLRSGANPSLKNYWGKSALEVAELNEDEQALALLKKHLN